MKKLTAIIGICLIACVTQAAGTTVSAPANSTANESTSVNSQKHFDPQAILAKINEALSKRQAQEQKATSNGRTDIASAIQKIITDLNNMKTALENKDRAGFKAANEQRKQDRQALEALTKTARQANGHGHNSNSTTTTSNTKL